MRLVWVTGCCSRPQRMNRPTGCFRTLGATGEPVSRGRISWPIRWSWSCLAGSPMVRDHVGCRQPALSVWSRSVGGISQTTHSFWKGLWDRYSMAAPQPRTPPERQYSDRRLRSKN